jgi:hypothetical protein
MPNKGLYFLGATGAIVLIGFEIGSIYYIMPFPGSQRDEAVTLAYLLYHNRVYFRLAGLALIAYPAYKMLFSRNYLLQTIVASVALVYLLVFSKINFKMRADAIFLPLTSVDLAPAGKNKVDRKSLVIGVEINGQARAYPIEIIGYHHQVRDTVGGRPVWVTYCTVCRTGRVFDPVINAKEHTFRLVGMDRFNALFEDAQTKTWWRQATGLAVAGPLTGSALEEIPSQQMSLLAWIDRFPNTLILQPDSAFAEAYKELALFDEGAISSSMERRDTLSWKDKSWVVGISIGQTSRAYDWNDLVAMRAINDQVGGLPVLLALEPDSVSFHAWRRDSLQFKFENNRLTDVNTQSVWNWHGRCVDGPLRGAQLQFVPAYQEFWHAWRTFRPGTETFIP